MDTSILVEGLLDLVCFIIVVTFHEAAHAWTSNRLGDDTAARQGRISLNPLAHIDPIGTIAFPLLNIFMNMAGSQFGLIGWGLPVPVNPTRLKHRLRDGMLIALAGPAMNIVVAFVAFLLVKLALLFGLSEVAEFCDQLGMVSLFLCFFNLLPVPPLDGSHVLRYLTGMSEEVFYGLCRFGFIFLYIIIHIDFVMRLVIVSTVATAALMHLVLGINM